MSHRAPEETQAEDARRRLRRPDAVHPTAGLDEPEPDLHASEDEAMPAMRISRRQVVALGVVVVALVAFVIAVLPQLDDVEDGLERVRSGDPGWLAIAFACTVLSFLGYVLTFEGVYVPRGDRVAQRLGFAESYQVTMASLAATRLFAAGGAGGVALTAWALRRAGMGARAVADRTVGFLALTYAVYMLALIVAGAGLHWGLWPGRAPFAITAVPALLALAFVLLVAATAFVPGDVERRAQRWAAGHGRSARLAGRLATVPATVATGVRIAVWHLRHGDVAVAGALAYWGFNVAILWACFHAFGEPPPVAVVVMAYFVGLLGNLLPLLGGVGGVDGGMIGALAAFSVDLGLATVAVLAYRLLAFWLPTLPGALAFLQLRRTVARWREERRREREAGVALTAATERYTY